VLVEQQLGHEKLEPLDLRLQFAYAAGIIDLGGVEMLPPAIVAVATNAMLATDIRDRQALGQGAVGIAQEALDLLRILSLAHESLLGSEGLP
jgi:hypothetical protein